MWRHTTTHVTLLMYGSGSIEYSMSAWTSTTSHREGTASTMENGHKLADGNADITTSSIDIDFRLIGIFYDASDSTTIATTDDDASGLAIHRR